jgi:hypothetical protein
MYRLSFKIFMFFMFIGILAYVSLCVSPSLLRM